MSEATEVRAETGEFFGTDPSEGKTTVTVRYSLARRAGYEYHGKVTTPGEELTRTGKWER